MLDLFAIFSKSGLVLWCFQSTGDAFASAVNALIREVILQGRSHKEEFQHNQLSLRFRMDNEFDLVFVTAYQKILQLSYVDKFLDDIQLEFRDKYRQDLESRNYFANYSMSGEFPKILRRAEEASKENRVPKMRTFQESHKSKKTIAALIENNKTKDAPKEVESKKDTRPIVAAALDEDLEDVTRNRQKMFERMNKKGSKGGADNKKSPPINKESGKGKKARVWDNQGHSTAGLDYSEAPSAPSGNGVLEERSRFQFQTSWVGQAKGDIRDIGFDDSSDDDCDDGDAAGHKAIVKGGLFGMFKGLVGQKALTRAEVDPVLDKLREHLITKNVAAEVATQLCKSVAVQMEGQILGSFQRVASVIRETLSDALVQVLSPKRRMDLLRDVLECRRDNRPYVIAFCGVNGVGKSTNLAKICFWLMENDCRVLIAACDTFRAGAVEQLRTHVRHLDTLHKDKVQLYERGYGKDAAGIASEAISFAREARFDVVLIDTAGRMQDNEPLMRALAKLVVVNRPDLLLFVGEALVGNEAVDQLTRFNIALADHSKMQGHPRLIDGIVLSKFDTIDDKVGAAVSMSYITGQPIVFVGTGQTYVDLKALNPKAVVKALMK
ncbi:signal recognition particle receptor subunit alpha-like [Varroa jacobsoni]|uniref:SRP54-type proteins GTP-binding domain-containing protein n=1 Tax=Varroa destructor TaxID=109461 RepID=A0A7M7JVX9_VARDE|nr:signal recognition particle receptor subunit alpha-like isoform X2 [Varroa destructor]XP_022693258.1 signal recognition particle receptor subunit alpha-like [Varroa jacobsoni]XP_022693260.1 signal recognition particle receptor subunit alpha-like [Varroa jacobsoni]XP_022693261.1 signal recognition particle receptor subunit alpha-like [Varroa jacobsoni]XP_022693262.1 signal recognition particle receptor subunit alpha-like [Varroa jacobsoni]